MSAQKIPPIATKISYHICGFKENPNYEIQVEIHGKHQQTITLKSEVPNYVFMVLNGNLMYLSYVWLGANSRTVTIKRFAKKEIGLQP